jgi:hypothetical protein
MVKCLLSSFRVAALGRNRVSTPHLTRANYGLYALDRASFSKQGLGAGAGIYLVGSRDAYDYATFAGVFFETLSRSFTARESCLVRDLRTAFLQELVGTANETTA